jgi:hypothetical protein
LPCPEYIAPIAPKDLANSISTMAGFANNLLDLRAVLGKRQDRRNGLLASQISLVLQSFRAGQKVWIDCRRADRSTDRAHLFAHGAQEGSQRLDPWASLSSHHPENGIIADWEHQSLGEARRRPAAECQSKVMDDAVEPPRPARPYAKHGFVKAFGENPSPAMRGIAGKPACHDPEAYART